MNFDPTHIKGILIDLDNTLYDYLPCNEAGKQAAFELLARSLSRTTPEIGRHFEIARKNVKTRLQREIGYETAASHSRLLYFQTMIEDLAHKSNPSLTKEADKIFWDNYLSTMTLLPGALDFLKILNAQKKRVAIVTDMMHSIQLKKLCHLQIDNHIDVIVSSEEVGKDKPHPASTLLALQKIKCTPRESVFIGES